MAPTDTFPLRFKRPQTRTALRTLAAAEGSSMNAVAERAIEHEVAMLGLDMERRLNEALSVVHSYIAEDDAEGYLEAIAEGERSGVDPMRDASAMHDPALAAKTAIQCEILNAFARH